MTKFRIMIPDLWCITTKGGSIYPRIFVSKEDAEDIQKSVYKGKGRVQQCFIKEEGE